MSSREIFVSRSRLDEDELSQPTPIKKAKTLLRLREHIRPRENEIEELKEKMNQLTEKMEILMEQYSSNKLSDEEIIYKKTTKSKVKTEVLKIIHENPGCKTSDILFELEYDPSLVIEILQELKTENKVKSKRLD